MAEVPILTAVRALEFFHNRLPTIGAVEAIGAVADGRTKTVAVRSEAEWRERFTEWHRTTYPGAAVDPHRRIAYMAALRHLGLVSEEQGGG